MSSAVFAGNCFNQILFRFQRCNSRLRYIVTSVLHNRMILLGNDDNITRLRHIFRGIRNSFCPCADTCNAVFQAQQYFPKKMPSRYTIVISATAAETSPAQQTTSHSNFNDFIFTLLHIPAFLDFPSDLPFVSGFSTIQGVPAQPQKIA